MSVGQLNADEDQIGRYDAGEMDEPLQRRDADGTARVDDRGSRNIPASTVLTRAESGAVERIGSARDSPDGGDGHLEDAAVIDRREDSPDLAGPRFGVQHGERRGASQ